MCFKNTALLMPEHHQAIYDVAACPTPPTPDGAQRAYPLTQRCNPVIFFVLGLLLVIAWGFQFGLYFVYWGFNPGYTVWLLCVGLIMLSWAAKTVTDVLRVGNDLVLIYGWRKTQLRIPLHTVNKVGYSMFRQTRCGGGYAFRPLMFSFGRYNSVALETTIPCNYCVFSCTWHGPSTISAVFSLADPNTFLAETFGIQPQALTQLSVVGAVPGATTIATSIAYGSVQQNVSAVPVATAVVTPGTEKQEPLM